MLRYLPKCGNIRLHLNSSRFVPKEWCQFHTGRRILDAKKVDPFPYMTSRETKWTSEKTFAVRNSERFKYEPHVLLICLCSLLIYFGVLREENELDDVSNKSTISGPSEEDLIKMIKSKQNHGEDASEYEVKLKKLIVDRLRREAGSNK